MIKEYLAELESSLLNNGFTYSVVCDDDELQIEVEMGDWKHDHLALDNFVRKFYSSRGVVVSVFEDVTDGDGSDCYSSVHTFTEV